LCLDGLQTLSDKQAEALARHEGGLSLSGLRTLSNRVAQILATHQGSLTLYALNTLSDEALADLRGKDDVQLPANLLR
jgi:hypothetical protein